MSNLLFPFLISALMGMGIGGELASLKEGGGPQGKDFIYRIASKAVEGVFFYV